MSKGLIYAFTGEGKGKTSAALGVAVRSALMGKEIDWIAWYKQGSWEIAEKHLGEQFPNLHMNFVGKGFLIANPELVKGEVKFARVGLQNHVIDTESKKSHIEAAENGLQLAAYSLQQKPFLLVMDEVLNAVSDGLISEEDVLKVLENRGETHLVLTGRADPQLTRSLLVKCDLVTECKKIKHPYDEGKLAVAGLDF